MDEEQKRLAEELLFSDKKAPGFAKQLYYGVLDASAIFPYPSVPEKDKDRLDAYLEKVRQFAENEIDPEWIDKHSEIPASVITGLGKLGVLGMTVPEEYGGLGMSQHAYCRVIEIISRRCASTALFINVHQSIGLKALLLFGTEKQRNRWLRPLATGEYLAAFSLTEPNAGSDAAGIETRAVYDPQKKIYRINGIKQWTSSGSIAKVLTVMAKVEVETEKGRQDKITAFLVNPEMPGFRVRAAELEKVGMRGTKTANLEFVDMEVPQENILGLIGGGLKVCLTTLDYGRTTFGAACTGAAKFLVKYAIKHARSRYQFRQPLSSFTLVKKKIAEMAAKAYAMEATTYLTAGLIDSGVEDIMLESTMLKVFASEALWSILYDAMQIYGGHSFFADHPLERMMRDARLNMIGEGSNEVMRVFIGATGMRNVGVDLQMSIKALKHPFKEYRLFKKAIMQMIRRFRRIKIPVQSDALKQEVNDLAKCVRRFGFAVVRLLAHYKEGIIEKQLELERIANSAIAIYTAIAVISKLDSQAAIRAKKQDSWEQDLASGKLYCQMACNQIKENLDSLFNADDCVIERLSDQLTGYAPHEK
jgi:acyl-CoA dehydrogenase family protein 9